MDNPMIAAQKAALQASQDMQIGSHASRVKQIAEEVAIRAYRLSARMKQVAEIAEGHEDSPGSVETFPATRFGNDAASIDQLLEVLSGEVENLRHLRKSAEVSKQLGDEFEPQIAAHVQQNGTPGQPAQGQPQPEVPVGVGPGQYL